MLLGDLVKIGKLTTEDLFPTNTSELRSGGCYEPRGPYWGGNSHDTPELSNQYDRFSELTPLTVQARNHGNLGGAAKTEHYEIASYTMLAQMAKDLGETDVAALLKENLDQEKEMAKKVESLAREVGKEVKAEAKQTASA